jgi:hypothetical protein
VGHGQPAGPAGRLALIVNTSAGTASTRLARRLAADLPEATVIETDAGDLTARLRLAAASARILGVAGGDTVSAAAAVAPPNPGSSTASTRTRWWSTARPTTSQTGDVAPRRGAQSGQRSEGR